MKRTTFLFALLLMTVSAMAQSVKIAPKLKKGDVKTYETTTDGVTMGQFIRTTAQNIFTVTEKTSNGFVIQNEAKIGDTQQNVNLANLTQVLNKVFENTMILYGTDKDGKIISIKNYAEMKQHSINIIDELFSKNLPQEVNAVLPKENILKMAEERFTEENMLKMAYSTPSPLSLNGKTITEGMEEETFNTQGLKMKTTYHVADGGKTIVADSQLNMNRAELKEYLVKQITQLMPQMAAMFESQIDQALNSGAVAVDANQKATYQIGTDGWVQQLTIDSESKQAGQVNKYTITYTLK